MLLEHIDQVRRFNRSVTQRVGALEDHFLGLDRPLAEARLLFEIGEEGAEVRALRGRLGLDSGYVSRLLRSLEGQDLITVTAGRTDRRTRETRLTGRGREELEELNRRSDGVAQGLLQPLTERQRQRLVLAMEEVERLLRAGAAALEPIAADDPEARWCLEQYYTELDQRFEGGFDLAATITANPEELVPPRGVFLVARLDGRAVGCGALKTSSPGVGTIKRMWVDRSARGLGLGHRIVEALEAHARQFGFPLVRLETNRSLTEARNLYRSHGYREVKPFHDDPYADFWFEKSL